MTFRLTYSSCLDKQFGSSVSELCLTSEKERKKIFPHTIEREDSSLLPLSLAQADKKMFEGSSHVIFLVLSILLSRRRRAERRKV